MRKEEHDKRKLISDKMAQSWKRDYSRYKGFFLNIWALYDAKPNFRAYLEILMSLGAIIIFSIFAIKPTILTIIDLNNEIKTKESINQKLSQKVNNLRLVTNLLQTESDNLNSISQAVPDSAAAETLIKQLESLSNDNGLTITNFVASDVVLRGEYLKKKRVDDLNPLSENVKELDFTFSVAGDYQNLYNFLVTAEKLRRPIKIDSFLFNSVRSADDTKVIIFTMTGRVPYNIQL